MGTPVSFTNKTDHDKVIEILLKVVVNTITLSLTISMVNSIHIDANHYDFSVIFTSFGPKLRCYGQQSTCYGFPIIAGPKPFSI
jgi:hypothetical protein